MIKAEIIADSLSDQGHRLTTFVLQFPRIVLAEFNTHRMLSRNSASSRAIPFNKMLEMVQENPFVPMMWMKDHKGMQGEDFFGNNSEEAKGLRHHWLHAREKAVYNAIMMNAMGCTKQIVNRLLEPFMWHKVIVTGTEWENFFALRAHEAAEIHIQELAHKMLQVYNEHQPEKLQPGQWHIPFGDKIQISRLEQYFATETDNEDQAVMIKIATARCARISYNDFDGKDDYYADVKLHDRLLAAGHMSPFEHCAQVMTEDQLDNNYRVESLLIPNNENIGEIVMKYKGWSGNFRGFVQYRKTIAGENKSDNRVKK